MSLFQIESEYVPRGDQPAAIDALCTGIDQGLRDQVLLGVTGSGKTFTMAHVIARLDRPALIMAPNKTLAAQLYNEFEKDSAINEDIDKLRHAATHALLTRRDVIIVASVSCIYGLGSPEYYAKMVIPVECGQAVAMETVIGRLVDVQYERNDYDLHRGTFRVRGDVLEIIPAYEHEQALRLEFFGDEIDGIYETDPLTGEILSRVQKTVIYPASHYVSDRDNLARAMADIREELRLRLEYFQEKNMLVEAQRLEQKTQLDLEMIEELGYCNGIENYSLHLDGRRTGQPPATLLDYFPRDFLLFMDESHISVSQVGGMFRGDRSRKETLVDYGFRLPSALDNRPLNFEEFLERIGATVFVSATPAPWELERAQGVVVEQIIRPTGLVDPEIEVVPTAGQMDHLMAQCLARIAANERVMVTTLTKRMAEDLTEFLQARGVRARYLHSDIDTLERVAIIQALRAGEFDVLVGINLLREGLDIPEVSLVAMLDADKEGFLRSTRSLIQTFGRAARNVNGKVLLYADSVTRSMAEAMEETRRRREKQTLYNEEHGIIPRSIRKSSENTLYDLHREIKELERAAERTADYDPGPENAAREVARLGREMRKAAEMLEFEEAARIRDRIKTLEKRYGLDGSRATRS